VKIVLPNHHEVLLYKFIYGNFKVERGGTLTDTSGCIVMGSVTGTIVAAKVTSIGNGYTTQMSAHAQNDQPLGVARPFAISLGIPQGCHINGVFFANLLSRSETKSVIQ
jgi:hypothetical protein